MHWSEFDRYILVPKLSLIAKWSCVNFFNPLPYQLNSECRSVPTLQRRDWLELKSLKLLPLWRLTSRLTVRYCVCFLLNHFACNLQEQILVCIARLSAEGYSQREVARMLGVSQGCVSKILRRNRDTGRPHQRWCGGRRSLTEKADSWSGQGQSLNLGSLSTRGDDLPIWEEVVSSEASVTGYPISLGVQSSVPDWLWITGDTTVCGGNAQNVGPHALEALCLLWWITLRTVSHWWSCSCVQQATGETDRCVHATHEWQPWSLGHGIGCHAPCWEK